MHHVGRSLLGAARLPPLLQEALLIGLWSGVLAFMSGPDICHFVLAFQGLLWIQALLDPCHGGLGRTQELRTQINANWTAASFAALEKLIAEEVPGGYAARDASGFLDEAHCAGAHGLTEADKAKLKKIAAPATPQAPKP
jgi:hypothetical protein